MAKIRDSQYTSNTLITRLQLLSTYMYPDVYKTVHISTLIYTRDYMRLVCQEKNKIVQKNWHSDVIGQSFCSYL